MGLWPELKFMMKPYTPKNWKLHTMEQFFDLVADSELMLSVRKYTNKCNIYLQSSLENHPNMVAKFGTSESIYVCQLKPHRSTLHSWASMINVLQHLGPHQSSMKLRSQKGNAYAMDNSNINQSDTWVIHVSTALLPLFSTRRYTNQVLMHFQQPKAETPSNSCSCLALSETLHEA